MARSRDARRLNRHSKGSTIIQVMIFLLGLGFVLWVAVNMAIDYRCKASPSKPVCQERSPVWRYFTSKE
ncbi:hypothetical protein SAMN06265795_12738 [Noviherbaspirillum humi]|uniref:Uncharacterized protein n=1 Tax=Noviherbaspirillum humi TaxID=1688639 RepID=A0A239LX44_9BURK|nr:hypothetical protein SAMN06265795_12738 [Noviherbaspirillum humi]